MRELKLRYKAPAPDTDEGWERQSLPIGNGRFGVNVFGLVDRERLQITENSVLTRNNLTNAAELRISFPHALTEATDYERDLILDSAAAHVRYDIGGVHFEREYFTSYPDAILGAKLTASKAGALSFTTELQIPFIDESGDPDTARTGDVSSSGNAIVASSHLSCYKINLACGLRVLTDGSVTAEDGKLTVSGASSAVLYFSCDTNYRLTPECFTAPDDQKIPDYDPAPDVAAILDRAEALGIDGYEKLKAAHIADFSEYFSRVKLDIGGEEEDIGGKTTDELLYNHRHGRRSRYLEQLYYQFGRYLLICSSREGELPPNLQGIWNCHKISPWGSGYWHNINVQMNYWPVFSTNLAELFKPYSDFNHAFRPKAEQTAAEYAEKLGLAEEGVTDYGWTVGTAVYPYRFSGMPGGHSGPGTAAMTSKLFTDWWEFTRDREILEKYVYPTVHGVSKSLVRSVAEYDGEYLSVFSASPEQTVSVRPPKPGEENVWNNGTWKYYQTVGCAFDQQLIQENGADDIRLAAELGYKDDVTETIAGQLGHYHPVEIGLDGQIKEYREESHYGEIGEADHRHISHLVGLMPGTIINRDTPAWIDSARRTLDFRTDRSTGWALAHRLNAWARSFDGTRAYRLLCNLIGERTFDNLWDSHPPFQIDGNFGGTSGVTEMLLQSHNGCIDILPALPPDWSDGSFTGLCARGNFTVDVKWSGCRAKYIRITSNGGELLKLYYPGIAGASVRSRGKDIAYGTDGRDTIVFDTDVGCEYIISDIPDMRRTAAPSKASVCGTVPHLVWEPSPDEGVTYNIYASTDSSPDYFPVASGLQATEFIDFSYKPTAGGYTMYRITAAAPDALESDGVTCVIVDS
ncbi:MAG: glycoside hydrolase family 95 protein [Clostridiales bacterium]|nr:glycoside hydrolase family 95 protein [Clostridiales bacterium]